jgi:tubulin polyglutamylase TTLL4
MKPSNQACGRGIKMVTKETKIKNKKDYQISEYIHNPHLINNFKYDLRIYILVTSYDPLRIYMYEEGLTRFATY